MDERNAILRSNQEAFEEEISGAATFGRLAGGFMLSSNYIIGDGIYKHFNKTYGAEIGKQAAEMAAHGANLNVVGNHMFLGSGLFSKGAEKMFGNGLADKTFSKSRNIFGKQVNFNWIGSKSFEARMINADEALGKTGFGISIGKPTNIMNSGVNAGSKAGIAKEAVEDYVKKEAFEKLEKESAEKFTKEAGTRAAGRTGSRTVNRPGVKAGPSRKVFGGTAAKTGSGEAAEEMAKRVAADKVKRESARKANETAAGFAAKKAGIEASEEVLSREAQNAAAKTWFGKFHNSWFAKTALGMNTVPFKNPLFMGALVANVGADVLTEVEANKAFTSHMMQDSPQYQVNRTAYSAIMSNSLRGENTEEYMFMLNRSSNSRHHLRRSKRY